MERLDEFVVNIRNVDAEGMHSRTIHTDLCGWGRSRPRFPADVEEITRLLWLYNQGHDTAVHFGRCCDAEREYWRLRQLDEMAAGLESIQQYEIVNAALAPAQNNGWLETDGESRCTPAPAQAPTFPSRYAMAVATGLALLVGSFGLSAISATWSPWWIALTMPIALGSTLLWVWGLVRLVPPRAN
jgi:hypothetical protein